MKALKEILVEVATLKRPVTAAAVATFIVTATGVAGVHLTGEEVAALLVGAGTVAAAAEKLFASSK